MQATLFTPKVTLLAVSDLTCDGDGTPSRHPFIGITQLVVAVAPLYCALAFEIPLLSRIHVTVITDQNKCSLTDSVSIPKS